MEIRGVDGVRGIDSSKVNKTQRKDSFETRDVSDSADISMEAKQRLEEEKIKSIINNTPDVREDRIQEVKAKLERGDYNNENVMNVVAEKIMKALGL